MTISNKLADLNRSRRNLRSAILTKMKTNPTMEDSETLRLVENDISFWENQLDYSVSGLVTTLKNSLKIG